MSGVFARQGAARLVVGKISSVGKVSTSYYVVGAEERLSSLRQPTDSRHQSNATLLFTAVAFTFCLGAVAAVFI